MAKTMEDVQNTKYQVANPERAHREAKVLILQESEYFPGCWSVGFNNPDNRTGWWETFDSKETAQAYIAALSEGPRGVVFTTEDGRHYTK